jgi:hypothetical protein
VGNPKLATWSVKQLRQNETLSGILPARSARVPKREMKIRTEDRDRALGSMIEQETGSTGAHARLSSRAGIMSCLGATSSLQDKNENGKANGNRAPELHTGNENQKQIWRQIDVQK